MSSSLDGMSPPPSRPASLVLLMDVIEHIENDTGFLNGLRARPSTSTATRASHHRPRVSVAVQLARQLSGTLSPVFKWIASAADRALRASGSSTSATFSAACCPSGFSRSSRSVSSDSSPTSHTSGIVTWTGGDAAATLFSGALLFSTRACRWQSQGADCGCQGCRTTPYASSLPDRSLLQRGAAASARHVPGVPSLRVRHASLCLVDDGSSDGTLKARSRP